MDAEATRVVEAMARRLSDVDPPRAQHLWMAEELWRVAVGHGALLFSAQEHEALLEGVEWVRLRGASSSVEAALLAREKLAVRREET